MNDLFERQKDFVERYAGVMGNKNPMVRKFGLFRAQDKCYVVEKCKNCKFLVYHQPGKNKFYKCELRGITNGPGTDHRVNWDACKKFEKDIDK